MTNFEFNSDALLRRSDALWILSNPHTRTHIEISSETAKALMSTRTASIESWAKILENSQGWVRSAFTNAEGLLADPTGFGPRQSEEPLKGKALAEALKKAWIFCDEGGESYREFLKVRTSVLDQNHLGSFHQWVGHFQTVQLRRKDKWRWWHDQKFSPDGLSVKNNLYQWVQEDFFDTYFAKQDLKDKRVLDFGCGNGYYSYKFSKLGANVLGLDTSSELLELAQKNFSKAPRLEFLDAKDPKQCLTELQKMPTESFDLIYLSDVLLFFFNDFKSNQPLVEELQVLLKAFHRILKKSGKLYLMEPNGVFWLAPWYGNESQSWTAITEYREQVYHVSPTPDRVILNLESAGFLLASYQHPPIKKFAPGMDAKAYAFAKSFPVWDFYIAQKG